MNALHPTAVLCLWASIAVFIQTLPVPGLWFGVLVVTMMAAVAARSRFRKLARRIRVLCLVTLVLFACATPGVRMLPDVSWLPLTWDGLGLGGEHAARLIAMVALVAMLLEWLSVDQLISALYHGLGGLSRFGMPVDRIAVRLSLVLGSMERSESGWRVWLLDAEAPVASGVTPVPVQALRSTDAACIILALGFVIVWSLV